MVGFVKSALKVFGINNGEELGSLDDFLEALPEAIGYNVRFKKKENDDGSRHYEVEGNEADEFLGSNAHMLDALAHLSMRVLRKQEGLQNEAVTEETSPEKFRVTFDAKGFREKKRADLVDLAKKIREKVIKNNGKPVYIQAMTPSERKVIHTTLAELGEVTSESIGKGNFKRIRVKLINAPKREPRSGGNRNQRRGNNNNNNRRRNNNGRRDNNYNRHTQHAVDEYGDVNGNVATPDEDYSAPHIDDNIGNRASKDEDKNNQM